ncbi:copper homeostasis protein CutC [Microbacterium sp.]|uniref:copper homeostasis protein CutC n=1 Tax=Microbacterium sp. TaxID=51671 RepID=UPI003A838AE7
MSPHIEIAVQDAAGARIAVAAGATRLELCQALALGGLTPSLGLLDAACAAVDPALLAVLVRPRGGGFVYDADEVAVVSADIRACVSRGVGGVVVGALDRSGGVDREVIRRWAGEAAGTPVVFHRAIDVLDPLPALDVLIEEGVTRVLTSGGEAVAADGLDTLSALVERAAGRIQIMAGGGVRPVDIPEIVATGVDAVHLSARRTAGGEHPSGPGGGATGHDVTDAAVVRTAVAAAV